MLINLYSHLNGGGLAINPESLVLVTNDENDNTIFLPIGLEELKALGQDCIALANALTPAQQRSDNS